MPMRVIGPDQVKKAAAGPVVNTQVGTAKPVSVRQPKIIGDFTDSKTKANLSKAVLGFGGALGDMMQDAQNKEDERSALHLKNAITEIENDMLFDPENGIKHKAGQAALDQLSGVSALGQNKGVAYNDQFNARLQEAIGQHTGRMSNRAKELADITTKERSLTFDKSLGQFAIAQQKAADDMAVDMAHQRIVERVFNNPQNRHIVSTALVEAVELTRNPEMGLAVKVGLNPNSSDPEVQKQIQQIEDAAKSGIYKTMINSLIASDKSSQANNIFKVVQDKMTAKDVAELAPKLRKLGETDAALAQWKQVVAAATKDGVFDAQAARTAINLETDAGKREAMLKNLNSLTAFNLAEKKKTQANASMALFKHVFTDGQPASTLPAEVRGQLSDKMIELLISGKVTARKHAADASTSKDVNIRHHERLGGATVSDGATKDAWTDMARDTPDEFVKATENTGILRQNMTLPEYRSVLKVRQNLVDEKKKENIELQNKIVFPQVKDYLDRLGYVETSDIYKNLNENASLADMFRQANIKWAEGSDTRMPDSEVDAFFAVAMIEVYKADNKPVSFGFSEGTDTLAGGEVHSFFNAARDGAVYKNLLGTQMDTRDPKDKQRLTAALGYQRTELDLVEDAVKYLDDHGNDLPTLFDVSNRIAEVEYPEMYIGQKDSIQETMDYAAVAKVDPRFLAYMIKAAPREHFPYTRTMNKVAVRAMIKDLKALQDNPKQYQVWRSSWMNSLNSAR